MTCFLDEMLGVSYYPRTTENLGSHFDSVRRVCTCSSHDLAADSNIQTCL